MRTTGRRQSPWIQTTAITLLVVAAILAGSATFGPAHLHSSAGAAGGALGTHPLAYASNPASVVETTSPGLTVPSTLAVAETFDVGSNPLGVAYDPLTSETWVANANSASLSVYSDMTNQVTATVNLAPWACQPQFLVYDSGTDQMFASCYTISGTYVIVVAATNHTVVAAPAIAIAFDYPFGLAYDSAKSEIFVAVSYTDELLIISDTNDSVVGFVPFSYGAAPLFAAYDPALGELFVTEYGFNQTAVVSDTTDTVLTNISVGGNPAGEVFDPHTGEVYVANTGTNNVSVISAATNTVVHTVAVGAAPQTIAFDSRTNSLLVANLNSSTVSVISDATHTVVQNASVGSGPIGIAYDSGTGAAFVGDANTNTVSILYPASPVTFGEEGLPVGSFWSVIIEGNTVYGYLTESFASTTASYQAYFPEGLYSFDVQPQTGYQASPGYGSFTVGATASIETIQFAPLFSVTFSESGLPLSTGWSVVLGSDAESSSGPSVTYQETNGTYSYVVGAIPGYVASPTHGSVTVGGTSVTVSVRYSPSYPITFVESGLPAGTSWAATLYGVTGISNGVNLTLFEPNGTYLFGVGPVPGFAVNRSSGTVIVAGAPVVVPLLFQTAQYTLTIGETGLPVGTTWSVTVNGVVHSTANPTIVLSEVNGSYPFTVTSISGYTVNPASGAIQVEGQAITLSLEYRSTGSAAPSVQVSVPGYTNDLYIAIGIAGLALGIGVGMLLSSRRPKAPSAGPPS